MLIQSLFLMISSLQVMIYLCLFIRPGFFCLWTKLPISRFRFLKNCSSGFCFCYHLLNLQSFFFTFINLSFYQKLLFSLKLSKFHFRLYCSCLGVSRPTASAWLSWCTWFSVGMAAFAGWPFWRSTLFWHYVRFLLFFSTLQPCMYFSLESEDLLINHIYGCFQLDLLLPSGHCIK